MTTRPTQQAIALGLAALVTLSLLAGLDDLAGRQHAAAQAQLAQAAAVRPV